MKFSYTLLLLFLYQFHAWAIDGKFELVIQKSNQKEISFSVNVKKKITITLYDSDNNTLFSEQIYGTNNSSLTYNLANYTKGDYYLIVSNEEKSVKHNIHVTKNTATLSPRPIMETYLNDKENLQILSIQ